MSIFNKSCSWLHSDACFFPSTLSFLPVQYIVMVEVIDDYKTQSHKKGWDEKKIILKKNASSEIPKCQEFSNQIAHSSSK